MALGWLAGGQTDRARRHTRPEREGASLSFSLWAQVHYFCACMCAFVFVRQPSFGVRMKKGVILFYRVLYPHSELGRREGACACPVATRLTTEVQLLSRVRARCG